MGKAILIVMDGFGLRFCRRGNAAKLAKTPNYHSLLKQCPHTKLGASGEAVGLPKGFIGGSEVGHMNMGAGRVVKQELVRINRAIADGSFFRNKVFLEAIKKVKSSKSRLHILGLVSDKGVHSDCNHLFALLKLASGQGIEVLVHFFSDGRDSPPKSAGKYLKMLKKSMKLYNAGRIATVIGRYYAMDRDNRWERTKKAYDAIANGAGRKAETAEEAIKQAYRNSETDEFIKPTIISCYDGIKAGDCLINFDYRTDRERQLTHAFLDEDFKQFKTRKLRIGFACMTRYYGSLKAPVAFEQQKIRNSLGEFVSKNRIRQLRIAESEKYAHVTFFFNGQVEKPFRFEDRVIVPSPKVATYDKAPEMSAEEVTKQVIRKIRTGKYGFIVLNFANPDMVGHTGDLKATIKAVEKTDECVGRVVEAARQEGYSVILTADHGNCETMVGKYQTSHTTNQIPLIVVSDRKCRLRKGVLGDIAPTILELIGIKKPREMTGRSLIKK